MRREIPSVIVEKIYGAEGGRCPSWMLLAKIPRACDYCRAKAFPNMRKTFGRPEETLRESNSFIYDERCDLFRQIDRYLQCPAIGVFFFFGLVTMRWEYCFSGYG